MHSSEPPFCCADRIIDNKTLRLITEASVSSPSKHDREQLDNNLRGNVMCLVFIMELLLFWYDYEYIMEPNVEFFS